MSEIVDKISSYNLFNNLLPGAVFAVLLSMLTRYNILQDDILAGAFFYYFVGMVISRIGSLVIEFTLKKIHLVKFSDYGDYVAASSKDSKIEILSEVNNMYRTFVSLFLCLGLCKLYELVRYEQLFMNNLFEVSMIIGLFLLFITSYRKQSAYINKRVAKLTGENQG